VPGEVQSLEWHLLRHDRTRSGPVGVPAIRDRASRLARVHSRPRLLGEAGRNQAGACGQGSPPARRQAAVNSSPFPEPGRRQSFKGSAASGAAALSPAAATEVSQSCVRRSAGRSRSTAPHLNPRGDSRFDGRPMLRRFGLPFALSRANAHGNQEPKVRDIAASWRRCVPFGKVLSVQAAAHPGHAGASGSTSHRNRSSLAWHQAW
jgi:hypothetical protein